MLETMFFIGANAVVIEGVQVGSGSVVAAGATQDVPENVVVAGVQLVSSKRLIPKPNKNS